MRKNQASRAFLLFSAGNKFPESEAKKPVFEAFFGASAHESAHEIPRICLYRMPSKPRDMGKTADCRAAPVHEANSCVCTQKDDWLVFAAWLDEFSSFYFINCRPRRKAGIFFHWSCNLMTLFLSILLESEIKWIPLHPVHRDTNKDETAKSFQSSGGESSKQPAANDMYGTTDQTPPIRERSTLMKRR